MQTVHFPYFRNNFKLKFVSRKKTSSKKTNDSRDQLFMFIHEENRDKKLEQLFCQFLVPFWLPFTNFQIRPIKILQTNPKLVIQDHSWPKMPILRHLKMILEFLRPLNALCKTKIPIFYRKNNHFTVKMGILRLSKNLEKFHKSNKIQFSCIQNHSKQFNTIHLGFEVTLVAFRTHLSILSTITMIMWLVGWYHVIDFLWKKSLHP